MLGLEVTLVERGDHLVPALASEELSDQVADLYREHGVELLLGEQIQEFRANGRSLTGAVTASGQEIEAFLAVVGVGVEPETEFPRGIGPRARQRRRRRRPLPGLGRRRLRDRRRRALRRHRRRAPAPDRALEQRPQPGHAISGRRSPRTAAPPTPRSPSSSRSCSTSSCRCSATRAPASTRS